MNLTAMILLLVGLIITAMVCVMIRNLLKASVALATMSAILSVIMFMVGAPLAAVFELSVCAGLITVVFISAISMTKVHTKEELAEKEKQRRRRFIALPVILILLLTLILVMVWPQISEFLALSPTGDIALDLGGETAQTFTWGKRQTDLLGQAIIVLAGVTGVLIFFKEDEHA